MAHIIGLMQPGHFQGHTFDIVSAFQVSYCSFYFSLSVWTTTINFFLLAYLFVLKLAILGS